MCGCSSRPPPLASGVGAWGSSSQAPSLTSDAGYLLSAACPDLGTFNITVIQVYALTNNAEEDEVEQFYEDLQDLLKLTPKDVLFIMGAWNTKVGRQEIPGVTGKFGLGVQNEAGQRLTEFCPENALVIANTLFQ